MIGRSIAVAMSGIALCGSLLAPHVRAIEWAAFEGSAHGFPALYDVGGKRLADGNFVQWIERGRLHVTITYDFGHGHRVEERVVISQRPELMQEAWQFVETRGGAPSRRFDVDFTSGRATAMTTEDGKNKREEDTLKITRGRAFAGFGFTLVAKALRPRLVRGEVITLQAVGFSPKPRAVDVEISYGGRDRVRMAGRSIAGDRFVVHPKIPAIAKLFVHVPDAQIWMTTPPAGFLRWEGPLAEPDDQIVRVDLLPGGTSGPATPIGTSGRTHDRDK
jgi:hypothetical protein